MQKNGNILDRRPACAAERIRDDDHDRTVPQWQYCSCARIYCRLDFVAKTDKELTRCVRKRVGKHCVRIIFPVAACQSKLRLERKALTWQNVKSSAARRLVSNDGNVCLMDTGAWIDTGPPQFIEPSKSKQKRWHVLDPLHHSHPSQ